MKICIHSNQFDGRGTGKTPYDYGVALRNILGHEVCYMTSSQSKNEGLHRISKEFPVYMYSGHADKDTGQVVKPQIEKLVEEHKIDFIQMLKYGSNDGATPTNCKAGIHYVFSGAEPHGDSYAAVSETLAHKFKLTDYVPHIIHKVEPTKDIRSALNIPKDALVVGRHGGYDTFDLPFVYEAIVDILNNRRDVYFLFLSTKPFIQHERVMHFDWVANEQGIYNFIHACDIMLHARHMGETFGLSVGEFAACNKPVMTWHGLGYNFYDTAHITQLKGKAILYRDKTEVVNYLSNIKPVDFAGTDWDTFTEIFSDKNVIKQYENVFLK